jgi:hypothetical protein
MYNVAIQLSVRGSFRRTGGKRGTGKNMAKRALGEFEHQVLLCILRNGSESYSVEVVLELESRSQHPGGADISRVTSLEFRLPMALPISW